MFMQYTYLTTVHYIVDVLERVLGYCTKDCDMFRNAFAHAENLSCSLCMKQLMTLLL